ncbi:MAG: dihydrolipoamide acetyltransferase family protein [Cyclobacteriaceae bacterium]
MAIVEMVMPKMGESVMEGTVLSWLKKAGDHIDEDESLLEVATDKVDTEIPSSYSGVVKELLAEEGQVVEVGKPIALIEVESNGAEKPAVHEEKVPEPESVAEELIEQVNGVKESIAATTTQTGRFYSPLVRNIAKQENIDIAELEAIPGTGLDNRVTKNDILAYIEKRKSSSQPAPTKISQPTPIKPAISGEDEIIQMDRMRKMIAERMLDSKRISPHVTSFVEADVTNMVTWRGRMKKVFMDKHQTTLTYTPIMIEAVVKAIQDYPMINIQLDGDNIIKKKAIHIGMAVALPNGNLIVPVIHNADKMNLLQLTQKVNDLARRARENQLKADDLQGGTYTISNVGSFGNVMGTPIIVQPQVGILALGTIEKKPSVIETDKGDFIGIRHKMFLSHSYDHRIVDGALGGMFVRRVADYLERFDLGRTD